MSKRRNFFDDQAGGPASSATVDDLAGAVELLRQSEVLRAKAAVKLARVRARGDGEAAVGMPVSQHLRWNTNARRGLVSSLGVLTDVAAELPTLMAALEAGEVNLDQAFAVAWPAARTTRALRRSLDTALATDTDGWTRQSPELLQAEVERLIEDLTPALTEQQEADRAQRQYLHLEPTLDGQGLRGWFNAWGIDAAFIDQTLRAASDRPVEDMPDPDGTIAGQPTRRAGQLFDGLLRIFRGWASGEGRDDAAAVPVTIYAIVDETANRTGSGQLATARRGLAPRLSAAAVQRLADEGARRVEVFAVDRKVVAVRGRAGHVHDDPQHRAWLCTPCHQTVHRWRWAGTVGAPTDRTPGRITWSRAGPTGRTTTSTTGRLAARLTRPPPQPDLDPFDDPLPF